MSWPRSSNHCLCFCWELGKLLYINFFIFLEYYMLANPDEKNDIIPEIMDAMNVADFVDEDIEQVMTETNMNYIHWNA